MQGLSIAVQKFILKAKNIKQTWFVIYRHETYKFFCLITVQYIDEMFKRVYLIYFLNITSKNMITQIAVCDEHFLTTYPNQIHGNKT